MINLFLIVSSRAVPQGLEMEPRDVVKSNVPSNMNLELKKFM